MKEVLQIVPRLPPAISGIGDYAVLLAAELARAEGWRTRFLITDSQWQGGDDVAGFPVEFLQRCETRGLEKMLEQAAPSDTPVFLHYVGYGYQKRGCPYWLVQGLERWRRAGAERRLVVMFHELFAFGPVWTSSFWLSPLQRYLAARLARCADCCITNMQAYADQLVKFAPAHAGRILVRPVFSTVGEPDAIPSLAAREPELILFGGGAWTTKAVAQRRDELESICAELNLDRIIAVGAKSNIEWHGRVPFEEAGVLPPAQVSQRLRHARVGYMDYFPGYLGKSTIFAAYCAHGILPVFPETNPSESDGVRRGDNYTTVQDLRSGLDRAAQQHVANRALAWYADHSLKRTATKIADQF